jgi:hypothetical protein
VNKVFKTNFVGEKIGRKNVRTNAVRTKVVRTEGA